MSEGSLERRRTPCQKRAEKTVELILVVAAGLLEEVGLEGLSTNLICKKAEISPPALYRYFPNKFAILKELGDRLMAKQNEAFEGWMAKPPNFDTAADDIEVFLHGQYDSTVSQPGGRWILRSLHSAPLLCDVRLQSHDGVADVITAYYAPYFPAIDLAELRRAVRLNIEIGSGVLEYLFDDPRADKDAVLRACAELQAREINHLRSRA